MAVHGRFHSTPPYWPVISGMVLHPSIDFQISYEFMVDTGADRTLIVPDHQELIDVPQNKLIPVEKPIHSFAGKLELECLPDCTIVFNDMNNNAYRFRKVKLYFLSKKSKRRVSAGGRPLTGVERFPSVIGRDLLAQVSLGYCKTSDYLFVTNEVDRYFNALHEHFPKPSMPEWDIWDLFH